MKTSVRPILCIAAFVVAAALFIGCQGESKTDEEKFGTLMMTLKSELHSGLPMQKEEPFELRAFRPFIADEWIGDAVAYGCYRAGQAPGQKGPSDAELLEDLNIIAGHWKLIRLYGADRDTKRILQLIETHGLPIKVIQGIWLAPEENDPEQKTSNEAQILLGVELARRFSDIIIAVCVGNETQVSWSAHRMDPETLVRYVRAVRSNVSAPVTTADDYMYWDKPESKRLSDEIDFVFTHIHPLWNGKTLDAAIDWMDSVYHQVQDLHPERTIVIGETGWATDYNADKKGPGEQGTLVKGAVGPDAQARFLVELNEWVKSNKVATFLFEAFDEKWKGGGESSPPNEIEKHWGVYNEDRTPKESFLEYLSSKK